MRYLTMFIISVLLILTGMVSGALAMEPFYKGEWGMSPAEIKALYGNNEPDDIRADQDNDNFIYTYKMQTADGLDFETSYRFEKATDGKERLYIAWNSFSVEGTDFKAYKKLLSELTNTLELSLKAKGCFQYFVEKAEGGEKDGCQRNQTYWLGPDECIVMMSYWYGEATISGMATAIDIDFYALSNAGNREYAEALKDLKWRDLK